MSKPRLSENQVWDIEIWISYLLRGGVLLCGTILTLGWGLYSFKTGSPSSPNGLQQLFSGGSVDISSIPIQPGDLFDRLKTLDPVAIMALGVRVLILLPIARVFFTLLIFIVQKDYIFVALSGAVFAFLTLGLLGGRAL